jgi:mono/diheme cytochrome c family protein
MRKVLASLLALGAIGLTGCVLPGKDAPPIEVFPDMDRQYKFKPQQGVTLFDDRRASRPPVAGTVARGQLRENESFYTGVEGDLYIGRNPQPLTREVLARGRQRFDIYCSPCHGRTGVGNGIVPTRAIGWIPGNLMEQRMIDMPDGEIFNVISYGRRTMSGYRAQISPDDRWAIVGYVRALQRTRLASIDDVPAELRQEVR